MILLIKIMLLHLETLSEGEIMNSKSTLNSDGSLQSGSIDNLR